MRPSRLVGLVALASGGLRRPVIEATGERVALFASAPVLRNRQYPQ